MKIGLVGLGKMGAALAQRLREQGCELVAWDQNAAANEAAGKAGLTIAAHPRAVAAASDVVLSIITEDHGVHRIYTGPDGFLTGDVAGKLFVEMSTLQPMTGRALAPLVADKGGRLIDSPVLGTIPQVRAGNLFALVGGRPEDLDRARPLLEKITRRIAHIGGNGSGYAMKLVVNLGLGAYMQALSESLALGARQGLTLELMLEVLQEAPYASNLLKSKLATLKGEKPDMSLDIKSLRKDMMSVVATGALTGVPMPLSAGTLTALSAAVANGKGDADMAELARFLREQMVQNFG